MTWSASKYTTKPGYSQRDIGGLPTAGTLVTGVPNLVATWSMVMPRVGVTTSDSLTAMPLSTAMVSAPARPLASAAASSRIRYLMAYLIVTPCNDSTDLGGAIGDAINTLIVLLNCGLIATHVSARSRLRGPALLTGPRAQLFRVFHHLGLAGRGRAGRGRPNHGDVGHARLGIRIAHP